MSEPVDTVEPEWRGQTLQALCDRISRGESATAIERSAGAKPGALSAWMLYSPERTSKYRAAQVASAEGYWDKAEMTLLDPAIEPARARELANHYRLTAEVRAPYVYGRKQQVQVQHQLVDDIGKLSNEELQRKIAELQSMPLLGVVADGAHGADGGQRADE